MKSYSNHNRKFKRLWIETLEQRIVLAGITPHSFAFDLIDLYDMRRQPDFQEIDGQAIGIALIDTGVDGTHDLLQDNYVTSLDLVYGHAGAYYSSNHGTHVAGIAASSALPPMPISFPYRFSQSLMAMLHGSIFWNLYNGFAKITVRTTSKL